MIPVHKDTDETKNADNTLAADAELEFAVEANKNYVFEAQLLLTSGSTTPDWKFDFIGPSGGTFYYGPHVYQSAPRWDGVSLATTPTALLTNGDAVEQGSTGAASVYGLFIRGTFKNGANAGNVQLRWAQNTSNGSNSTVKAGSVLLYQKVN